MGGFALQGSKHDEGAAGQSLLLVTYSVGRPHVDASLLRAGLSHLWRAPKKLGLDEDHGHGDAEPITWRERERWSQDQLT